MDEDGISIAADAIHRFQLYDNNGNQGNKAVTPITNAAAHKVDATAGYPKVTGVTISSSAGADSTYYAGDTIAVTVAFDSTVAVTGTPQLALGIGSATKQANYASGTGTASLVFRYVVVAGDLDADGISIGRGALALNGGTIKLGTKDAVLSLGNHAIANAASHKVITAPSVSGVSITSDAGSDSTYVEGDTISVVVVFSDSVDVTGTPQLALTVDTLTRQADYVSGTGTDSLMFRYVLPGSSTDRDSDGISVDSTALTLPSGATIRRAGSSTVNATLGLGAHAIGDDRNHQVARRPSMAPIHFPIETDPGSDRTYAAGDYLALRLTWNDRVDKPTWQQMRLAIEIGEDTVTAMPFQQNPWAVWFRYLVTEADLDEDGISLPAGALTNTGTVRLEGTLVDADNSLAAVTLTDTVTHKVNGAQAVPHVTNTTIESEAGNDSTYARGDVIEIGLWFSENVDVTGSPRLALAMGTETRQAVYSLGSGGNSLVFRYLVGPGDVDSTGISIGSSALTLNGGTIRRAGSVVNAYLGLRVHRVAEAAAHKVDGLAGPPAVVRMPITSDAGTDSTYAAGDTVQVAVVFNESVDVTGTPRLALGIGVQTRQASYAGGTGTDSLTFRYVVASGDADSDGLSIGGSALGLNGGTIRRAGAAVDATLSIVNFVVANAAAHKVLASGATIVTGTSFTSDAGADSIYVEGDTIAIEVVFSQAVDVTGTPQLALIMSSTVQASYVSGTGTATLRFNYVVAPGDSDTNGISYGRNALTLNGGTIRRAGVNVYLSLWSHVATDDRAHRVWQVPKIASVSLPSGAGSDETWAMGDIIDFFVVFDRTFNASVTTANSGLWLTIGENVREGYVQNVNAGTRTIHWRYNPVLADLDADGLSVDSMTVGGSDYIRTPGAPAGAANAFLDFTPLLNLSAHKVNGAQAVPHVTGASIASDAGSDGTYALGDTIEVGLVFNENVDVTGAPRLELTIGTQTRRASYASGTGGDSLTFRYVVQLADADTTGISIGASALTLPAGTTIRRAGSGTVNAYLGLRSHAIANAATHKVSGALGLPMVTGLAISSDAGADSIYAAGDTVEVTVTFDSTVAVTGTPQVALEVDTLTRQAEYASGTGTNSLVFQYVVVAADRDSTGISIGASALALNSGTIRASGGTTNAYLALGSHAIADAAAHQVWGAYVPVVTSVFFVSAANTGLPYASTDSVFGLGDVIRVAVGFNVAVEVGAGAQQPRLALGIDSQTRQASYCDTTAPGSTGANAVVFCYTVVAADVDSTGISVGANALTLNGGTIRRSGTTGDANLSLSPWNFANSVLFQVDGGKETAPSVSGMTITSDAGADSTYAAGNVIEVEVAFDRAVTVTGTPRLALRIGSDTVQASYASGTGTDVLAFRHTVGASDVDADGISVDSTALALNGGTIVLAGGSAAASLNLGSNAVTNVGAHKVAGNALYVTRVSVGAPVMGDTFERGDTIRTFVTFSGPAAVTGTPQLALRIGSATRQASYNSGPSGSWFIAFDYVVASGDADADGLSVEAGALTLNGGTVRRQQTTVNALLDLTGWTIANQSNRKVAGGTLTAASVSGLSITSSSVVGDSTYRRGEEIEVQVVFDRRVTVTGTPQVALAIGTQTRQASYASGTATDTLVFRYVVVQADADTDGLSIGASALGLNGGTIADARDGSTAAGLGLGAHAVTNAGAHKVDGSVLPPPVVASAALTGSKAVWASHFHAGAWIQVTVTFDRAVDVTGTPRVAVVIGSATRHAEYTSGTGTTALVFRYLVHGYDNSGADPYTVARDALTLNGGTINEVGSSRAAVLDLRSGLTGERVSPGELRGPSGLTLNTPSSGDTYAIGETIEATVTFSGDLVVVGGSGPQLALSIGDSTRQATWTAGGGNRHGSFTFRYVVQASDMDADGISIAANAVNGGNLQSWPHARAPFRGLGVLAVANDGTRKVDGGLGAVVAGLSIGSPLVGDTFERGEVIEASVVFSAAVDVTGTPQLALGVDTLTRQAEYARGTGTDTLVFRYTVVAADSDTVGISIGASALTLNGGTIRQAGTTRSAVLGLGSHAVTNSSGHKVAGGTFTASAVSGVSITSVPSSDSTYGRTEQIEVEVEFTRAVTVTGAPQLALEIGSDTVQAAYASGSGTATLAFSYTVVATNEDSTGISIGASALTLNSGTINDARDGTTAASLGLGSAAVANARAHKVNGSVGPPGVTALSISSPTVGDTFERGETIEVALAFTRAVDVTGTPQLALTIGSATRQAEYASGTGTDTLVFQYVVAAADADADGLSIGASALALNGGTIKVAGGTLDALLALGSNAVTNSAGHKVAGGTFTTPAVSAVTVSSAPAADSTYKLGESIEVKVAFGRPVAVTGVPRLALTIGTQTRQAAYDSATSKADTLVFEYAVRPADTDTVGLSIGASALTLNGGTIADVRPGAAAAALSLGSHAVTNAAAHKVDGSQGPPGVAGLSVASPLVGATFERGDTVVATVTFNKQVDVTGTPQLALSIGTQTRQAGYASGTGTAALVFRYVVVQADVDTDGLSVGASALALNSGTIDVAGGTTDALLSLAHHAISNDGALRVAGGTFTASSVSGVSIASSPADGSVYGLSEQVEVEVTFGRHVSVTGAPQLALAIGSQTRQAAYDSATSVGAGGRVLTFQYTVQSSDSDANGLSIGASALALNGGTISDARDGSTAAGLGLGSHAITNASGQAVDGSQGPPGVSGVSIASPPVGTTFERGDTIIATVTFNKAVDVTGTPQLALTIGAATKQASYASGTGTASLVFRYVVVTADVDADGLSIGASALALNGGMIDVANGTVDAVLGLGAHAVTNSAGHKVAGGTFTAASVSGVSLTSSPAVATTYARGEQIEVQVTFNRRVAVTDTPQVALTVGAATRQADYASGTGTYTLTFRYTVVAADADTDGIEVGASALALNSGTINDARDGTTAAALGLGSHALSAAAGHKVDGTLAGASVSGVAVSSTPESGDTYGLGERIEVQVTFDRAVTVTGAPQLALTVGTATRQASYVGGSGTATLSFAYRVQGAGSGGSGTGGVDADADGVGVAAAALTLNGATIVNTADGVRPAVLALGSHAIAAAANDKVDGTVEAAPAVMAMAVTSTPGASGLYGPSSVIRVTVTFSRPVEVVGAPQLAIEIGTAVRQASYVSGSGTPTVVFEYVVQPADRDEDGISIPADALTATGGAALRIAGGTMAATLDLSGHEVENLEEHQVNGAGGTDPVFGRAEYEFKLTEDVAGPVVVGTVSATDPFGGEVTYSLAAGDEGLFEVDARTGEVRYVGTGEDAESRSEFVMIVRATADDGERTGDATVTVRLVNVNDAPVFTAERYAFAMAENAAGPLALGAVEAVDLDEGDTLTYRLATGDADRFAVDSVTGEVRYVGSGEDYEGAGPKSWELEVTATDLAGSSARAVVAVALTNVNEGPAFADSAYAFDLAENERGPLLLGEVRATDPDAGDWLSYALTAGDAERFKVNATSGAVRYVGSGEDAETGPGSWELEVTATDRGGLTARTRVVVTLEDQNEGPVFVEPIWEWELAEHVAGPVELGTVEATDVDAGDTLRYSLSGAGAALFDVGESSGVVRYVGAGEDAETGPDGWEFEVVATDRAGLAAVAKVRVLLLDVNEAPAFVDSAYAFELAENVRGPRELGRVEATDPDRDDALTYSLAQGDPGRFAVDGASGRVRYVGAGEDYEDGPPEFALTVRVTDGGGLTAEAAVVVTLLDVNEGPEAVGSLSPPALEVGGAPWEVGLGEYFRDPDGDALSYVVVSSSPDVAPASVSGAGRLSVAPREIGASVLTVTATDAGGLTATQQASVTVSASRADRARALKLTLAAFGRSLGTETVETIGGRLGLEPSGSPGGSHVQLGGRSLSCLAFGGAGTVAVAETDSTGEASAASSPAGSGRCGLESLVRDATGLLGFQITHPGVAGGSAGGTLDLAAILFGDGAAGLAAAGGGSLRQGGSYQGQREEGALPAERERGGIAFSPLTGRDLRSRSSFQLSFGGSGGEQGGADAASASPDKSPAQAASQAGWTLWGQANVGEFEGRPEDDFAMDGRTRSAYVGLDYRFGSGFLMGLAGSRSDVAANYESGINGVGKTKAHLTSLYPYLSWSSQGGFGIWGLAGAGMGAANVGEQGPTYDADLRMRMGALGVRQKLVGGLALKADAFAVRMMTDASNGHVAAVTADAQRVRLAPELGGQWTSGSIAMRTRIEVGGRYDRGDAETGMGAEAGADLGFTHEGSGLSLDARGRMLLIHQDRNFKDWGAAVALRIQPRSEAGGLSFSLEPSWGNASGGAQTLWQGGADVWRTAGVPGVGAMGPTAPGGAVPAGGDQPGHGGATGQGGPASPGAGPAQGFPSAYGFGAPQAIRGWAPDGLAMEVGYGVALPGGGQLKPFGRWSREGAAGYRLNVGTQWATLGGETAEQQASGLRLVMDFFGEQATDGFQPPDRRVGLAGTITFK